MPVDPDDELGRRCGDCTVQPVAHPVVGVIDDGDPVVVDGKPAGDAQRVVVGGRHGDRQRSGAVALGADRADGGRQIRLLVAHRQHERHTTVPPLGVGVVLAGGVVSVGRVAVAGVAQAPSISSVIPWMAAASFWADGSIGPACMAISLVMSPCTLILPAMKACIPACGLPSTRIALAVA